MQTSTPQTSKARRDESHHLCCVSVKSKVYILIQAKAAWVHLLHQKVLQ